MAGNIENPNLWRLQTPEGIKYKLIQRSGSISRTEARETDVLLIQSEDLEDFANEVLPRFEIIQNMDGTLSLQVEQNLVIQNQPLYHGVDIAWKDFIDGKPVDPFDEDSGADANTYAPVVQVSLTYSPEAWIDWKVDGRASGKYIHTPAGASVWLPATVGSDPTTGALVGTNDAGQANAVKAKEGIVPTTVVVPEVDWGTIWPAMPQEFFRDYYIGVLRENIGKVNDAAVPLLFDAPAETMLLAGWSYREYLNWRNDVENYPPSGGAPTPGSVHYLVEVSLKFIEKHVQDPTGGQGGVPIVYGHNHFWRPNRGWSKLVKSDSTPVHEAVDFGVFLDDAFIFI